MAQIDDRLLMLDRHGVLKVPPALWLSMLFLCRHWIVLLMLLVSVRKTPEAAQWLTSFTWVALPLEAPIFLLLAAIAQRTPQAGPSWRYIWKYGRSIILLTAIMHLLFVAWSLWNADMWRRWPELFLASCGLLDLSIIYSVYKDKFYYHLFNDFPSSEKKQPHDSDIYWF